jgi:Rv0078B-related antitoxin
MDAAYPPTDGLARKLKTTFDLQRFGIAMMRQNLVRRHPGESDAEIDARLRAWLRRRPGAEHGDAVGRPGSWPREQA